MVKLTKQRKQEKKRKKKTKGVNREGGGQTKGNKTNKQTY
jgi:hypothetical protein